VTAYTTLHIGEAAVEVAAVVAVMALAVALHAFIQRRFKSEVLRKHNDVAGFVFTAAGVIYAVVLGFVVVVVWEKYDATEALVQDHPISIVLWEASPAQYVRRCEPNCGKTSMRSST
jgi:high-affinity Fe2+/Pb2+ permease